MLDFLLQIFHLLLSMARESELLLEAPEHGWAGFDGGFAQHVVQNYDLFEAE